MENQTEAYDAYIRSLFASEDDALAETLAEMERADVPSINVSATEGKLLEVLTLAVGARRVLEIGTLGGYSGIHFARALPEHGRLVTLEISEKHAEVARRNFERAGVAHKVEIRLGPAAYSLRNMADDQEPPFDIVFIDADKDAYPDYLRLSLPLLREGGLLLADNTLPDAVLTGEDTGAKRYNALVAEREDLVSVVIPTLRTGGLDGLTVSVKRTPSV